MRILQVTNGFPPTATAGVEQYTHQLSRGLRTHHDVRVFCRESDPQRTDYDLLDDQFDGFPVRRVVNDFQHVAQIQDYYLDRRIEAIFEQTLHEWQPDLIHFQHCIGLSASLLEVARRREVPHLLTLHDYWFICSRVQLLHRQGHICPGPIASVDCYDCTMSPDDVIRPLKRTWFFRLLRSRLNDYTKGRILGALSRATPSLSAARTEQELSPFRERDRYMLSLLESTPLILTPSKFVRDLYVEYGVSESRIQVLPLGLELSLWRVASPKKPNPGNGLRVGYLGSLLRHKGVNILVHAFHQLRTPGATLQIYGFAMPGDPFMSHLRNLGDQDPRVKLMGRYHHKDLPDILSGIDVVVISSLWHETFSIVAREALLSGTPVVAFDIGALPEIIDSGQNGLLVPVGDAEALHDALHNLSIDPDLLAHLQNGARVSAQRIKNMDDHVNEVDLLYESVLRPAAGDRQAHTSLPG
jgi:glycosyltransferase involved in cell wall biosynthesis